MNIFIWIAVGYIIGWVAPDIFKDYTTKSMLMSPFLGIVGAILGGFIATSMITTANVSSGSSFSTIVAILGSIILIVFGKKFDRI